MKAFKKFPDGREVCFSSTGGRKEYQRRREEAWDRDRGMCCLCGRFVPLEEATLEHLDGRGMNGSKRDDRVHKCGIAHWFGNNAKGSISYSRYMDKPLEERIQLCQGVLISRGGFSWTEDVMGRINTTPKEQMDTLQSTKPK